MGETETGLKMMSILACICWHEFDLNPNRIYHIRLEGEYLIERIEASVFQTIKGHTSNIIIINILIKQRLKECVQCRNTCLRSSHS